MHAKREDPVAVVCPGGLASLDADSGLFAWKPWEQTQELPSLSAGGYPLETVLWHKMQHWLGVRWRYPPSQRFRIKP